MFRVYFVYIRTVQHRVSLLSPSRRHLDRRRSARLHCFPLEQIPPRNDSCDFRPRCDCCGSVRASGRPGARQVAPGFASSVAPCPAEAGFIAARARSPGPVVRLPLHVLRLLCRLDKSRTSALLRRSGTPNLLGCTEAQLDQLPLDLSPCPFPRSPLPRVSVSARSHAPRLPAGILLGRRALFRFLAPPP